jgi:hypothetical protein
LPKAWAFSLVPEGRSSEFASKATASAAKTSQNQNPPLRRGASSVIEFPPC